MAWTKTVRVNRWGNGLGIRLPKEFIDSAGITDTSRVEVRATEYGLVISCTKEPRRHVPLAVRLQGWHGQPYELTDEDKAWLDMRPMGEEV